MTSLSMIMLLAISFYRLPDFVRGPMLNPFYHDVGLTKDVVGTVRATVGMASIFAGVAAGGYFSLRLGYMRALLIGGILQALSNLMYIAQVWAGHDVVMLAVTIGTENLTNGMGSAAFVAYLSGLCNTEFTATQYALLSSLATVGVNILSASGGWLADELGWVEFFLVSMGLTVPGLVLLGVIMRHPRLGPPARTQIDSSPGKAGTG